MRAVRTSGAGDVDVLGWAEVPDPVAGPGELVVDVVASAVNRADLLQRQGFYPPPPGASEILGLECSGRVAAVGAGVDGWSVGDELCALLAGGGYAEKVAVPAAQCMPVPPGVDLVVAAALPEVACTVWSNVVQVARLAAGESFLVHGGSSGIGTMAIQVAKALDAAPVICTVGAADKAARCHELGADVTVNYKEQDFVEVVHAATDGHGADVVLDTIGAKYLDRNLDVLAVNGRIANIGLQGGRKAELDLAKLMGKRGAILSTTLRGRPSEEKAAVVASVREHVWPRIEAGEVHAVVDRVLPITQVADAHRLVESSGHVGKVLLAV
jgi:putative PIG3 family NAD(P)H quinone oxidoreductase